MVKGRTCRILLLILITATTTHVTEFRRVLDWCYVAGLRLATTGWSLHGICRLEIRLRDGDGRLPDLTGQIRRPGWAYIQDEAAADTTPKATVDVVASTKSYEAFVRAIDWCQSHALESQLVVGSDGDRYSVKVSRLDDSDTRLAGLLEELEAEPDLWTVAVPV